MNVLSKQHQTRPKIAVIGAGWAGLSAAVHLGNKAEVHVFEAGKQAGGRARMLSSRRSLSAKPSFLAHKMPANKCSGATA